MKNTNYFTVMGWMVNALKLNGNALNVYALIYGFSQDRESCFKGSLTYICNSVGISRNTVIAILKDLEHQRFITKKTIQQNNRIMGNEYRINPLIVPSAISALPSAISGGGSAVSDTFGSAISAPNIYNNNNTIDSGALDFLKEHFTASYESFCLGFKKQIYQWQKFTDDFNDTVIQEGLNYDAKLFGRLRKYARNYIANQTQFKVIHNNEVAITARPDLKRIG